MTKKKQPRTTETLSKLDDYLEKEGDRETFQSVAVKEVLSWQIKQVTEMQNYRRSDLSN